MIHSKWQGTQSLIRADAFFALLLGLMLPVSALAQEGGMGGGDDEPDHGSDAEALTQYVDLQPEFVLNYGRDDRMRFLRMEVTILARDADADAEVNHHSPALRHIVVMTVSATPREEMNSREGRQALRERLMRAMREELENETGEERLIREVLFSNLIMQ